MSQLLLVIVIVAAVVLVATMLSARMRNVPHPGTATNVGRTRGTNEASDANGTAPRPRAERAAVTETPPPPTPLPKAPAPGTSEDLTAATMSFNASDLDFAMMPTAEDVGDPATAVGEMSANDVAPNAALPKAGSAANTAARSAAATANSTATAGTYPASAAAPTAPAGTSTATAATPTGSARTATATAATPTAAGTPAARAAVIAGDAPPEGPRKLPPTEVFAKLFELALGKARPATAVTAGHQEVADATSAALEDATTQQRYAPRRPNMLPRVLSASNDDSFSRRDLAALIARDPSLVGNLLKIANSSFYRVTPEPVESVDRAVVLLGTDGIRSLVTAALMQPIFRIGGADFPRFPEIAWEHTFRAANASVPYNFLVEKSDPGAAELLSLVMGLASIVVFRVSIDQYAKNPRLRPDAGVIASLLDTHSATVARRIAASWELSEATLAGLDGQTTSVSKYATPLGRSIYYGRVVGALAVLRINHVIDDETAKMSIPVTNMPEAQLERMWTRLSPKLEK